MPSFVVYFREMEYTVTWSDVLFFFHCYCFVTGYILKGHDVIILNEILIFFLVQQSILIMLWNDGIMLFIKTEHNVPFYKGTISKVRYSS